MGTQRANLLDFIFSRYGHEVIDKWLFWVLQQFLQVTGRWQIDICSFFFQPIWPNFYVSANIPSGSAVPGKLLHLQWGGGNFAESNAYSVFLQRAKVTNGLRIAGWWRWLTMGFPTNKQLAGRGTIFHGRDSLYAPVEKCLEADIVNQS